MRQKQVGRRAGPSIDTPGGTRTWGMRLAGLLLLAAPLHAQGILGARTTGGHLEIVALASGRVIKSWSSREGGALEAAGFSAGSRYVATIEWEPGGSNGTVLPGSAVYITDPGSARVVRRVEGGVAAAWLGADELIVVIGRAVEGEDSYVGERLVRVGPTGPERDVSGCKGPKRPHSATAAHAVFVTCTTSDWQRRAYRIDGRVDSVVPTTLLTSDVSPSGRFAIIRPYAAESTYVQDGDTVHGPGQSILGPGDEPVGWADASGDVLVVRLRGAPLRLAPGQPHALIVPRPRNQRAMPVDYDLRDMATGQLRRRFRAIMAPITVDGQPVFTISGRFAMAAQLAVTQ